MNLAALKPWIPPYLQQTQVQVTGLMTFKTLQNVIRTHPQALFPILAKLFPLLRSTLPAPPGRPQGEGHHLPGAWPGPAPPGLTLLPTSWALSALPVLKDWS